ncbi:uncharacterized [Tachysurus ichikawai]
MGCFPNDSLLPTKCTKVDSISPLCSALFIKEESFDIHSELCGLSYLQGARRFTHFPKRAVTLNLRAAEPLAMPSWRRNLTFCLQKTHDEGKTRGFEPAPQHAQFALRESQWPVGPCMCAALERVRKSVFLH